MTEFSESDKETFEQAIDTWGLDVQLEKAEEEAAELLLALKHYRAGKIPIEELFDEIADVKIMIGQLNHSMNSELIDRRIDQKMVRLDQLLDSIEDQPERETISEPYPDTIFRFCGQCHDITEWSKADKACSIGYKCECGLFERMGNIYIDELVNENVTTRPE